MGSSYSLLITKYIVINGRMLKSVHDDHVELNINTEKISRFSRNSTKSNHHIFYFDDDIKQHCYQLFSKIKNFTLRVRIYYKRKRIYVIEDDTTDKTYISRKVIASNSGWLLYRF